MSDSARVTGALIKAILEAVYTKKFEPETRELEAEMIAIGETVVDRYISKYMKTVESLPQDMIRWTTCFYGIVVPEGPLNRFIGKYWQLALARSVPYIEAVQQSLVEHTDIAERLLAYFNRREALEKRQKKMRTDIQAFVRQFKTIKKLVLAWPEVKELVPGIDADSECKALAIRVEDIRQLLEAA